MPRGRVAGTGGERSCFIPGEGRSVLVFDAKHVFGADFDCLDCGREWPCLSYQDLICCVLDGDMAAVTAFMSWFVPTARAALPGLSEARVRRRVVGWCETRQTAMV